MNELLPCPFCGERIRLRERGGQIRCQRCGAEGPEAEEGTEAQEWNRRHTQPQTPVAADRGLEDGS